MEIAEMKPVSKKASANKPEKGNAGAALGVVLLKQADTIAAAEVKQAESRKDTVIRLVKFTRDDHLEFRRTLAERLDSYKMQAEMLNLTLSAYQQSDPSVNSVIVTISLWRKMSEAIETGYKPDMSQSWAYISQKATEALAAKLAPHAGTEETPKTASPTRRRGRPGKTNVEKALAVLDGMPMQDLETIGKWIASKIGKPIPYEAIKK